MVSINDIDQFLRTSGEKMVDKTQIAQKMVDKDAITTEEHLCGRRVAERFSYRENLGYCLGWQVMTILLEELEKEIKSKS